jgi:membrane associated rhomboid family serine protease
VEHQLIAIPVRSHRQAMDWSLVLASQGIEHSIHGEDGGAWNLMVFSQDHTAALQALELYRRENRSWRWVRHEVRPGLLFDWSALAWVCLLLVFFWLDSLKHLDSVATMRGSAVLQGQWWRVFTAMWLHGDPGHLATNAVFGFLLLGLTMGHHGTGVGLLAAYLAGAGGNLATGFIGAPDGASLGASGLVMGALGLLAVQSLSAWQQTAFKLKYLLSGLAGGVMLFALLGLTPGTDVMAHFGGFVSGLLLGGALTVLSIDARKTKLNLVSGFLFALMVIVPWACVLR